MAYNNTDMKYLLRSIKYFLFFSLLFFIFTAIMVLFTDGTTFENVFRLKGSILFPSDYAMLKILALFLAVAAIYPSLAFVKKEAFIGGTFDENKNKIIGVFDNAGYMLENEDDEVLSFRIKNGFNRFSRLYEDRITITKDENPLILTGYRKDIFRLASAIEYATRREEETEA